MGIGDYIGARKYVQPRADVTVLAVDIDKKREVELTGV